MTRLANTMKLDVILQVRNKIYHISIGLALLIAAIMRGFFTQTALETALPAFVLVAIGSTTYLFVAGMMIFEKNERTLDGLIVTPLTTQEYMTSKAVTLTLLATLETSIIILLSYGFGFNPLYLYSGILLLGFMMVLMGIIQVVRFDTVTDFMVPAFAIGIITQLPIFLLFSFGEAIRGLWYIVPTAAPFILMRAGFADMLPWQILYGFGYSSLWIIGLGIWAQRAFDHHIIMKGGS